MKISMQSRVTLYPLSIRMDKKNYIVEESISGDYFEMPKICIDAIERLEQGVTVGLVEEELKEKYPDEEVNLVDFVGQLVELGLVREIDGELVSRKEKQQKSAKGFTWLPAKVGRIFFNSKMNKLYLLLFFANIFILVSHPNFLPHYRDVFPYESMMINMITYMVISLIFIFIHEMGHVLAIRAHDLPAQLGVGNRLLFIVFETNLTPAWKLEPRERNVLFFAGMAFEQVILFIAFILMLLFPNTALAPFLGIVVFDIFIKAVYQCCFYMKTDMYYVVENITGCYNLLESAKEYLRKRFWKRSRSNNEAPDLLEEELPIIRMYSWFYVVGVGVTLSMFLVYLIPQLYYAYTFIFSNIVDTSGNAAFWDAVFFLVYNLFIIGLLIYIVMKRRRVERMDAS